MLFYTHKPKHQTLSSLLEEKKKKNMHLKYYNIYHTAAYFVHRHIIMHQSTHIQS